MKTKIKPVVNDVTLVKESEKKRGLISRIGNLLFGKDGVRRAINSAYHEIIIPSAKDLFVATIENATRKVIYGDYGDVGRRTRRSPYSRDIRSVSYNTAYSSPGNSYVEPVRVAGVKTYALRTRNDAKEVLRALIDNARIYDNFAFVYDYYTLIGQPAEHTDYDYGWTLDDLENTFIRETAQGYIIDFEKPRPAR